MTAPRRPLTALLAALSLLALPAGPLAAQGVARGIGIKPGTAVPPIERVKAALAQAGVRACAPVVMQAADFLFENGEGDFTLQPLGPDANRWPVVLTIESAHAASGRTRLSILTLAPAGTCSGSYEQIITWPQTCAVLKTTVFAAFASERPLFRSVRQSELSPGIQLYLMPSGTGCVSVKKELIG